MKNSRTRERGFHNDRHSSKTNRGNIPSSASCPGYGDTYLKKDDGSVQTNQNGNSQTSHQTVQGHKLMHKVDGTTELLWQVSYYRNHFVRKQDGLKESSI